MSQNFTIRVEPVTPPKPPAGNPLRDRLVILFGIGVILVIIYAFWGSRLVSSSEDSSIHAMSTTAPASQSTCAIQVGSQVEVVIAGNVHVRRTPGYSGKGTDDELCGGTSAGERFTVTAGPQYADGLAWWYVSNARCQGWVAETTSNGQIILQDP